MGRANKPHHPTPTSPKMWEKEVDSESFTRNWWRALHHVYRIYVEKMKNIWIFSLEQFGHINFTNMDILHAIQKIIKIRDVGIESQHPKISG